MPQILIYSKSYCPYCRRAIALFDKLGQKPEVIDLLDQPEKTSEMISMANGKTTVPQIFINGKHIGGCDEAHALYGSGDLQKLLND